MEERGKRGEEKSPFLFLMALGVTLAFALVVMVVGIVLPRLHEVHRPIARVVLVAMLVPLFRMPGRHMEIDRLKRARLAYDHHGLRINEYRRRRIADLDAPINAGLDFAGYDDVCVLGLRGCGAEQ